MDFQALLFDPIYLVQGVDATLTLAGVSESIDGLTVLDKTGGIAIEGDGPDVQTILPAAVIRVAELTAKGVTARQVIRAILEFNGKRWRVKTYRPKPSPKGELDGELFLLLEDLPFVEQVVIEPESDGP